jgi:NitT/TauT family transport system permease protein
VADDKPRFSVSNIAIRKRLQVVFTVLVAMVSVMMWEFLTWALRIPNYLVPPPSRVAAFMKANHVAIFRHAAVTLEEALLGLALAFAVGIALGAVFAMSQTLELIVLPYAIASQAIPIVAVAPLLVLWLGPGLSSKVAMATLLCVFPMIINTTRGLRSATNEQVRLFRIYRATRTQEFLKLRLPSSLPFVLAGMKISAALAMIGAIVAEYAGADEGLGYLITQATYRLDTVAEFGAVLAAALCGLALYGGMAIIERLMTYPKRTSST